MMMPGPEYSYRERCETLQRQIEGRDSKIQALELQLGALVPLADAADELINLQRKWEKNNCPSTQEGMLVGWTRLIRCVNEWIKVRPSEKRFEERGDAHE
jgi:hypothetical protein